MWCCVLCRALLVAAVITYLICVLFLSGLQKEDLDIGTLRKLQKHNVNIDDIDSQLKNECLLYSTIASPDLQEPATTEAILPVSIAERLYKCETDKMLKETIIGKLIDCIDLQQNVENYRRSNLVTKLSEDRGKVKEEFSETDIDRSNLQTHAMQAAMENQNIAQTITITTPSMGRDVKGKYPQKNLIQFWQTHINNFYPKIIDGNKETQISPNVSVQTNNGFLEKNVNRTFVNDMTLYLINSPEKVAEMSQYQANNNKLLNMTRFIDHLEAKQKVGMGKIKPEEIDSENYKYNESRLNNYFVNHYTPHKEFYGRHQYQRETNNITQQERKDSNMNEIITQSYEGLNEKNRETIVNPLIENKVNDFAEFITQSYNSTESSYANTTDVNKFEKNEDTSYFKNLNISRYALEGIAKTIKDSVLRDLRKEIEEKPPTRKVLTSVSELTTSRNPTKKNNEKEREDATNVLQRVVVTLEKLKPQRNVSLIFMPPPFPVKQPTYNNNLKPYFLPYTVGKQNQILNIITSNRKPIIELRGFKNIPITIQTNSQEVRPLAVSLKQPPTLIHQNIIITTKRTYMKGKNERLLHNWKNINIEDINDLYPEITYVGTTYNPTKTTENSYLSSDIEFDAKQDLKRLRLSDNNKKKPRYRERFIDLPVKKEKPQYNLLKYTPTKSYERFHEKLEKEDSPHSSENPSSGMWQDSDMINIESRQQMPLNNAKRLSSLYDGSNFKHFMETQEKVNEMLERLLATKKIFKMQSKESFK